jgi:hypothetical protein
MKILFLDIDGVLSCFGVRGLCGTRLDLLADVVKRTGAEVVLSSSWRHPHCRDQLKRLERELHRRGVEFLSATPILPGEPRGNEIGAWLASASRRHEVTTFAILDDDPNNEIGQLLQPALVKCDGYQGLTVEKAAEVVRILNP